MSIQGKYHKNKKTIQISSEQQKNATTPVMFASSESAFSRLSNMHRIVISVLLVAILGIILSFIFEEKDPVQVEKSVPINSKPVSDVTVKQENKLTTVIPSAKEYPIEPTIIPEIINSNINIEPNVDAFEDVSNDNTQSDEPEYQVDVEPSQADTQLSRGERWVIYTIVEGDTLASIFREQELPLADLYALTAIEGTDRPLSRIMPQQELRFKINNSEDLDVLEIQGRNKNVKFVRNSGGNFVRQ